MALKPLDPAPKVPLPNAWELLASEAGGSPHGARATVALFNGTARAFQTVLLGDVEAQQALATAYSGITGFSTADITTALAQLTCAVYGLLQQREAHGDAHESQATRLVNLARDAGAELFHTPEGEAYATITVEGHTETWPLKVKGFRRWLARLFYEAEDTSPGSQAVQDALGVLEGKALFDGPENSVYTRLAEQNGVIYLDLANASWQAVEISARGWHIVEPAPVKFRRSKGMLSLPAPDHGGDLSVLRPFLNIATEEDWHLIVSWLLATLRPTGPYPVLVVHGEQGSAKSTLVRVLRSLIDPNVAALRSTPRDERDLVIAATNSWLIALDNLSHLPEWLSDALCRLATGSGFATRELYTDTEEALFCAQRPIVLNGIAELATRGDLLDRSLILYLPTIPEEERKDQEIFWRDFESARPQILGALLDVASAALCNLPNVKLDRLPRMADFAKWACAAAPACGWTPQQFLDAYTGVRTAAHELTLEASPVAPLIRDLVATHGNWNGTASALLPELETLAAGSGSLAQGTAKVSRDVTKQQGWPKNARALSSALRRLAPSLRAVGVAVEFGNRIITLANNGQAKTTAGNSTSGNPGRTTGQI